MNFSRVLARIVSHGCLPLCRSFSSLVLGYELQELVRGYLMLPSRRSSAPIRELKEGSVGGLSISGGVGSSARAASNLLTVDLLFCSLLNALTFSLHRESQDTSAAG